MDNAACITTFNKEIEWDEVKKYLKFNFDKGNQKK